MPLILVLVQHFDGCACRSIQSFSYLPREGGYVISTGNQNQLLSACCFHTWRNLLSLRLLCHHQICLKVDKSWIGSCWKRERVGSRLTVLVTNIILLRQRLVKYNKSDWQKVKLILKVFTYEAASVNTELSQNLNIMAVQVSYASRRLFESSLF